MELKRPRLTSERKEKCKSLLEICERVCMDSIGLPYLYHLIGETHPHIYEHLFDLATICSVNEFRSWADEEEEGELKCGMCSVGNLRYGLNEKLERDYKKLECDNCIRSNLEMIEYRINFELNEANEEETRSEYEELKKDIDFRILYMGRHVTNLCMKEDGSFFM